MFFRPGPRRPSGAITARPIICLCLIRARMCLIHDTRILVLTNQPPSAYTDNRQTARIINVKKKRETKEERKELKKKEKN